MKQTAVEWLLEEWPILESQIPPRIIKQAKEMEKEHLCEMYIQGRNDYHLDYYPEKHAKETYDEMFKKD